MLLVLAIFYQLYEYGFAEKNRIRVISRRQTKSEQFSLLQRPFTKLINVMQTQLLSDTTFNQETVLQNSRV